MTMPVTGFIKDALKRFSKVDKKYCTSEGTE
jgi:hypothetical protein